MKLTEIQKKIFQLEFEIFHSKILINSNYGFNAKLNMHSIYKKNSILKKQLYGFKKIEAIILDRKQKLEKIKSLNNER